MRHASNPVTASGWMLAALLVLGGCHDDSAAFNEAETPDEPRTHITAAEFADQLADGVRPNIDWITWYREGSSLDIYPLELRTRGEINADLTARGRRLPGGGYGCIVCQTPEDRELSNARMLIIRHLQPADCPVVPCYMGPSPESQFEGTANRLGLPYTLVPEEQRVLQVSLKDGTIGMVRFVHNNDGTIEEVLLEEVRR